MVLFPSISNRRKGAATYSLVFASLVFAAPHAEALDIQFDYSRDTTGFFAPGTEGRRILESAAAYYEILIEDTLGELRPIPPNRITVDYIDPVTQAIVEFVPPPIPANTVLIYVGATNLSGSFIGSAWHGGIYPYGTNSWLDYVDTRGQTGIVYGAGANEVAPWGGSITVDTLDETGAARRWDYTLGVKPASTGLHLYSLLIHELTHLLGFGTCDAWRGRVDGSGRFVGSHVVTANGGPVSLDSGQTHWLQGTLSTIFGSSETQETAMDPLLIEDSVSYATTLDMAALSDIGWQIGAAQSVPEIPVLATAIQPVDHSVVLSWEGAPQRRYTVLTTSDYLKWKAHGSPLNGVSGLMQTAVPIDGASIAFRLLVERWPAETVAMANARATSPQDVEEGKLSARSRAGSGAMQRVPAGGGGHRCAACAAQSTESPLESLLRVRWGALHGR
jgi:hypothetical protein